MAKKDRRVMQQLSNAARLGRTALATKLLEQNLYAGQDQLMLALAQLDGQTPSALAAEIGVRPPTVTKTIARLQAQGFVDKVESTTDARQAHIHLTQAGLNAIVGIEKAIKKTEKRALEGLDKKDRKVLHKYLRRIEANLSHMPDKDIDLADDEIEPAEATPA